MMGDSGPLVPPLSWRAVIEGGRVSLLPMLYRSLWLQTLGPSVAAVERRLEVDGALSGFTIAPGDLLQPSAIDHSAVVNPVPLP